MLLLLSLSLIVEETFSFDVVIMSIAWVSRITQSHTHTFAISCQLSFGNWKVSKNERETESRWRNFEIICCCVSSWWCFLLLVVNERTQHVAGFANVGAVTLVCTVLSLFNSSNHQHIISGADLLLSFYLTLPSFVMLRMFPCVYVIYWEN